MQHVVYTEYMFVCFFNKKNWSSIIKTCFNNDIC